jgi:solute carrier family 25 carnitine/acylcarnitine transporter 20/29
VRHAIQGVQAPLQHCPCRNMPEPTPQPRVWHRFLAGTVSGVALCAVGHPLDTVKVVMQTSSSGTQPASFRSVVRDIVRAQGVRGFYRGVGPPLLLTGGINTVLWGFQFNLTDAMERRGLGGGPTQRAMAAALVSGAAISILVSPIEMVKTQLQVAARASGSGPRPTALGVVREIVRTHGVRGGLYRGWSGVVLARMSNYGYYGGFAYFSALFSSGKGESGARATLTSLGAGGMAGICYWLCAFPFDTLKVSVGPIGRSLLFPTWLTEPLSTPGKNDGHAGRAEPQWDGACAVV